MLQNYVSELAYNLNIINLTIDTAGRYLVDVVVVIQAIVDIGSEVLCHGDRFNVLTHKIYG